MNRTIVHLDITGLLADSKDLANVEKISENLVDMLKKRHLHLNKIREQQKPEKFYCLSNTPHIGGSGILQEIDLMM